MLPRSSGRRRCGAATTAGRAGDPNPNCDQLHATRFKITGTFTPGTPARPTPDDCRSAAAGRSARGTFTVAIDTADENILDVTGDKVPDRCGAVSGTRPATFEASYTFTVTRVDDGNGWVDSYLLNGTVDQGGVKRGTTRSSTAPRSPRVAPASARAASSCTAPTARSLEPPSVADDDTTIAGFGDYTLYQRSRSSDDGEVARRARRARRSSS